jgi:predicted CXXCH cytochrome family protein
MRTLVASGLIVLAVLSGCTRTWNYGGLKEYAPEEPSAPPSACEPCHEREFDSWKKSRHAESPLMSRVAVQELRACGACHENSLAHSEDPETSTPSTPSTLDKAAQNAVCGKCHYNQEVVGRHAINPRDRHGLLTSAGFEGHSKQISCLECHSAHAGKAKMLAGARAHVCFRCHKSAIVTMGVFQPANYLTFGKACQACHTVHGGSMVSKTARMSVGVCVVCHFGGIALTGGGE